MEYKIYINIFVIYSIKMFHFIKNYIIYLYFNIHIWYYKYISKLFYLKPKLIECELPEWIEISSLIRLNNTYQLVNTNITNIKMIKFINVK